MEIKLSDWIKFKDKMSRLSQKASDELLTWIQKNGGYAAIDADSLINYAYALVTKYGEGSAALSALMYDTMAEVSGASVLPAVVADTATYEEVAKAFNWAKGISQNEEYISTFAGKLVKQAGADTTLQNAKRDKSKGAEFAWIPVGDTCAFCTLLASNGWQKASADTIKGDHAEHIHANCDCEFMIRFNSDTSVEGYNPDKYKSELTDAGGRTWNERVNALRRENYAENKDKINAQKRIAYAKRTELEEN